jgi:protein O-mannosyl-transferase
MQDSSSRRRKHEPKTQALPEGAHPAPSNLIPLAALSLIVMGVTLFVHWPVLTADVMSFDDEEAIIQNHLVQNPSWHSVDRFFGEVLLSSVVPGYYRPLTLTSLMLDWAMGGRPDHFYPFHRTSLVLHLGSTLLVILLCYQLFGRPVVAALVGLLFGVHPLTVEPIAWVMERKTILAAFFSFACLCAYVRYARGPGRHWFVWALLFYLLSLLAKPTGTPLPIMLLLLDHWPLRRLSRRAVFEKVPFYALSGIFAVLCCVCEQRVNPLSLPAVLSPLHLPLRVCYLVVFYLAKILVPIHLSSVYILPEPLSLRNPIVVLSIAGTVLLIAGLAISRRWTPALWVGLAIFFVGLAPTMGLVGYSWVVASDKYVYLPAVGLAIVVAWLLERIGAGGPGRGRRRQAAILAVVLIAAGLLATGTRRYLAQWQSTERFIDYMLSLTPDSPELRNHSGCARLAKGETDQALREFDRAIRLQPTNAYAYANRGIAHHARGDYDQEVRDCTRAIELKPDFAEAYNNRGGAYGAKGDYDAEIRDCTKALELRPDLLNAYSNRGCAYRRKGDYERAIRDLTKAIEFGPGLPMAYRPDAHSERGKAYISLGRYDEAISDFTLAISLRPDDAMLYFNRSSACGRRGDYPRAIEDLNRVIALKPDYADAYQNRALAHCELKAYDKAWADLESCRRLGVTPSPDLVRRIAAASGRTE